MEQLCTHNHYTHHSFSVKVKCCYCEVKKKKSATKMYPNQNKIDVFYKNC